MLFGGRRRPPRTSHAIRIPSRPVDSFSSAHLLRFNTFQNNVTALFCETSKGPACVSEWMGVFCFIISKSKWKHLRPSIRPTFNGKCFCSCDSSQDVRRCAYFCVFLQRASSCAIAEKTFFIVKYVLESKSCTFWKIPNFSYISRSLTKKCLKQKFLAINYINFFNDNEILLFK